MVDMVEWKMADEFTPHKGNIERSFTQVQDFHPSAFNLWVETFRKELDKAAGKMAEAYQGLRTGDPQTPSIHITPHREGDYLFVVYPAQTYTDPEEFNQALWDLTGPNLRLLAAMRGRVLYGLEMLSPQPKNVNEEDGSKVLRTPSFLQLQYRLGSPSGILPSSAANPGSTAPAFGALSVPRYNGDILLKQNRFQFPYHLLRTEPEDEADVMRGVALRDIREPFAEIVRKLYNVTEAGTVATPA